MTRQGFVVPGRPTPWKRTRGRGRRRYTAPKYRAYKQAIQLAARAAGVTPLTGEVSVVIEVVCPDRRWADVDNYCKAVLDALNGLAYADDRQVSHLEATRRLCAEGEEPHLSVAISDERGR